MMATTTDVANIARQVGEAGHANLANFLSVRGVRFNLREGGYCARFVRQVHEAALGLPGFHWEFRAPNARAMEELLEAGETKVLSPVAGDIIAINGGSGFYGHIGINLGGGLFAENTSSSRGPGTTISLVTAVAARVSGYYRAVPLPGSQLAFVMVLLPGSEHAFDCTARTLEAMAALRELSGADVDFIANHITENNPKVYLRQR